jgi:hypothetical protein
LQSEIIDALRGIVAFVQLLSLGFATIGIRATFSGIGGQLLKDALGSRPPSKATGFGSTAR